MAKSAQQSVMVAKASAAVKAKFVEDKDLQGKALSEVTKLGLNATRTLKIS